MKRVKLLTLIPKENLPDIDAGDRLRVVRKLILREDQRTASVEYEVEVYRLTEPVE